MKHVTTLFFVGLFGVTLAACDSKTTQQATTKTDQAIEAVDTRVDKVSQQPNTLQPLAQTVDKQIKVAHSLVHPDRSPSQQSEKEQP